MQNKTNVDVIIKTKGKSKFLQNQIIDVKINLVFSFGIIYNNILQIYFYDKYINDDLNDNEKILYYRYAKNYLLKLTFNIDNNVVIGIGFGKIFDSGLTNYIGILNGKFFKNNFFGFINGYINQNYGDKILLKGFFYLYIYKENLNSFYLNYYNIDFGKYIKLKIINLDNLLIKEEKKYYTAYLFEPSKNHFQITLGEKKSENINIINYRYIKKDISIVFCKQDYKLKYFFIKINGKEIFLYEENIYCIKNSIKYIDVENGYGKINFNLKLQISDLGIILFLKGNIKTIKYPNY